MTARPLHRAFAFLDPLLTRPALVVEGDHPLGRAAHVRHDEANPGIKLARMPLDLGNHPSRLGPGSVDAVLASAASVEQGSDHPLAQAILRRAQGLIIPPPTGFENIEGMGARAEVDGATMFLGNRRLMDAQGLDLGGRPQLLLRS